MIAIGGPSARSVLIAGMSAALVGGAVLMPVSGTRPAETLPMIDFSPFRLSAAASQIVPTASNPITEAYDSIEPWVAYGFELIDYALSVVPVLWWVAPGIDLAYFTIEPLVQAAVYSGSYVLFGQFDQIPQAISNGVEESVQNFVDYSIAWIGSLIPLPPIPPFPPTPPFAGASTANAPAAASLVTERRSGPVAAQTITAPADAETVTGAETVDTAAVESDNAPVEVLAVAPAQEVDLPATVEAETPRRQLGRAPRSGPVTPGRALPGTNQAAPGSAEVTAPASTAAPATAGGSGKANAARASRGAARAG